MTTTLAAHPSGLGTELAHRSGSGLDVTLYWNQPPDRVTVVVHDHQAGHRFELSVDRARAGYAFNHPFAYAASQDRPPTTASDRPGITTDRATTPGHLQRHRPADQPAPPITPADAQ
jgi:hypothetical protein